MKDFGESIHELQTMAGESQEELHSTSKALLEMASSVRMREHKFRVWYHGKMIIKSLNDILTDPSNNFMFLDGEVMEFTGLLDKNGKEVCEGDILRFEFPEHVAKEPDNGWVIRDNSEGSWRVQSYAWWSYIIPSDVEIIGNTYENKELVN